MWDLQVLKTLDLLLGELMRKILVRMSKFVQNKEEMALSRALAFHLLLRRTLTDMEFKKLELLVHTVVVPYCCYLFLCS
jgi:hypothetical protein